MRCTITMSQLKLMFFTANQTFGLCASGSNRFNETTHDHLIKPFVDSYQFYRHRVFVRSRCNRTCGVRNLVVKKKNAVKCNAFFPLRAHPCGRPTRHVDPARITATSAKFFLKRDASHSCSTKSPSGLTAAHFLTLFSRTVVACLV